MHLHASVAVLVIAERMVDLAVPLHHTWTYQALLHDLLDMRANRVKVAVRHMNAAIIIARAVCRANSNALCLCTGCF
jgi:hypothetical protein